MSENEKSLVNILREAKIIAIVGLSNEPEKDSYRVAEFLQKQNYIIVPVTPKYPEILGQKSYPKLSDIPFSIDIVDVFRRSDAVLPIAQETLQMKKLPKAFWMQLDVHNIEAQKLLEEKGIQVIQNSCIKIVYKNLLMDNVNETLQK